MSTIPSEFSEELLRKFYDQALARRPTLEPVDECWEWSAPSRRCNRYSQLWWCEERALVHRLSYVTFIGKIPADRPHILHSCDHKWCWNPTHLSVGTIEINNLQAQMRGRARAKYQTSVSPGAMRQRAKTMRRRNALGLPHVEDVSSPDGYIEPD